MVAAAELEPEPRGADTLMHPAKVETMPRSQQASRNNFQNQSSQMGLEQKWEDRGSSSLVPWGNKGFWNFRKDYDPEWESGGETGPCCHQIRPSSPGQPKGQSVPRGVGRAYSLQSHLWPRPRGLTVAEDKQPRESR